MTGVQPAISFKVDVTVRVGVSREYGKILVGFECQRVCGTRSIVNRIVAARNGFVRVLIPVGEFGVDDEIELRRRIFGIQHERVRLIVVVVQHRRNPRDNQLSTGWKHDTEGILVVPIVVGEHRNVFVGQHLERAFSVGFVHGDGARFVLVHHEFVLEHRVRKDANVGVVCIGQYDQVLQRTRLLVRRLEQDAIHEMFSAHVCVVLVFLYR